CRYGGILLDYGKLYRVTADDKSHCQLVKCDRDRGPLRVGTAAKEYHSGVWKLIKRRGLTPFPGVRTKHAEATRLRPRSPIVLYWSHRRACASLLHNNVHNAITSLLCRPCI
ncbi:hypothetical protein PoB_000392400, partial [Plakobranchus ocellatus]